MLREATMCSPAFIKAITVARIAAMPLAVATQASAPFQRSETFLKGGYRGIGKAGIYITRLGPGKSRGGFGSITEDKARRQVKRFRMLVELAALLAGTYGQGLEGPIGIARNSSGLHQIKVELLAI
jgi:hypothetical protein